VADLASEAEEGAGEALGDVFGGELSDAAQGFLGVGGDDAQQVGLEAGVLADQGVQGLAGPGADAAALGGFGGDGIGAAGEEGHGGEDFPGGHVAHDDLFAFGGELGQLDAAGFGEVQGGGGLPFAEEGLPAAEDLRGAQREDLVPLLGGEALEEPLRSREGRVHGALSLSRRICLLRRKDRGLSGG